MTYIKDRKSKGGLRTAARLCAVQMVYRAIILESEVEYDDEEIFISESLSLFEMDRDFFVLLIQKAKDNLLEIDKTVSKNLSDRWKFERLDNVMKSILRLGATELMYFKDIPINIVLNEYIEISKSFFEKNEVSFINGLLNSIANPA